MSRKAIFLFLSGIAFISVSGFVDVPDYEDAFYCPYKVKSVKEWIQFDDSIGSNKQLFSERKYFPNGQLKQIVHFNAIGDTASISVFKLNQDSLIKEESQLYFFKKWKAEATWDYIKGENHPYMKEEFDMKTKTIYNYDLNGNIINEEVYYNYENEQKKLRAGYDYEYDGDGRIKKVSEYYFNGDGKRETGYSSYEYVYEKDSLGQLVRKKIRTKINFFEEFVTTKNGDFGHRNVPEKNDTVKIVFETDVYNKKKEKIKELLYNNSEWGKQGPLYRVCTYVYEYY